MISQRAKSEEPGLPQTACAPDLFSRFDDLKPTQATELGYPVRYYMGFNEEFPSRKTIRPGSWLGKVIDGIEINSRGGKGSRPNWLVWLLWGVEELLMWWMWLLGYQADLLVKAKNTLKGAKNTQMQEVNADIASKQIQAKWTGTDVSWATAIDELARKYYVPTETISPGEAQSAYYANVIDRNALEDYSLLSAQCKVATEIRVETGQQRPDVQSLLSLWHRHTIDQQRAEQQIRELGWLKSEYVQWQEELWWQLPQSGQFVSWMRSGFLDEKTAAALNLDSDFDSAYSDDVKRWAEASGLRDDDVKRLWRSTYQWPQMGEALNWYYRSRAGYIGAENAVNEQDLQQFIIRSATPPEYHGAVFASRFTPLSSRLLRAAYDEDTATDQQVMAALRADGFSDSDAQTLFSEWQQLKPKYTAAKVGLPAVSRLVSLYADALIGDGEFRSGCNRLGLNDSQTQEAIQGAKHERLIKHRSAMLSALRASYLAGAIDDSVLHAVLASVSPDATAVTDLSGYWRAELEVRPRPDAAGELAQSFQSGVINESEYVASLTQLRYTPEQIARILYAQQATEWSKKFKDAEMLVKHARGSLTSQARQWADLIKQAEKLHGKVEQRTRTHAGKLLTWIQASVTGKPKPVAKKGAQPGVTYVESVQALDEAAQAVEKGNGSFALGGSGIAVAAAGQPDSATAGETGTGGNGEPAGGAGDGTDSSTPASAAPDQGLTDGNGAADSSGPAEPPG